MAFYRIMEKDREPYRNTPADCTTLQMKLSEQKGSTEHERRTEGRY